MAAIASLIMPMYNGSRYLSLAIESVLAQTTRDFELVIWDDGSEDESFSIALDYAQRDPRVKAFTTEHKGHAASLNAATAHTSGRYIGWVDCDDLLAPTALEETILVLDWHSNVGLVYTDYIVIDEQGIERKPGGRCAIPYSKEGLLESFMTFHFRLFRRSLFEQVGRVDETFECAVDYDLCLRLSEITEFMHLKKPLYYYRSHADNVSHQKRERQNSCSLRAVSQAKQRRGLSETSEPTSPVSQVEPSQVKALKFYWSPSRQFFACDDVYYENQGSTPTDPSHDLVHLIVAANGGLAWLPQKERSLACLAEYNAVFLETIFNKTCDLMSFGTSSSTELLVETLDYMKWFVEQHFSPFPMSTEAAYSQFCRQIDPFIVSRLFPYYLSVKRYEKEHSNHRESEYQLSFTATDQPATDESEWLAQWFIYQQLKAVKFDQHVLEAVEADL